MENMFFETFKSIQVLHSEYTSFLFSFSTAPYFTRDGAKLVQPKVIKTSFGYNRFDCRGSKIWNSNLPPDVKKQDLVNHL